MINQVAAYVRDDLIFCGFKIIDFILSLGLSPSVCVDALLPSDFGQNLWIPPIWVSSQALKLLMSASGALHPVPTSFPPLKTFVSPHRAPVSYLRWSAAHGLGHLI